MVARRLRRRPNIKATLRQSVRWAADGGDRDNVGEKLVIRPGQAGSPATVMTTCPRKRAVWLINSTAKVIFKRFFSCSGSFNHFLL